jgi:hypothetical protein
MEDNPLPFKWVKVSSPEKDREREKIVREMPPDS